MALRCSRIGDNGYVNSHLYPMRLLICLGVIAGSCSLGERFGRRSDEDYLSDDRSHLRRTAQEVGVGESVTIVRPTNLTEGGIPLLDFDQVRGEMELLGFDCTEVHEGMDKDLSEAGVRCGYSPDGPRDVIVGVFVRRP